MKSINIIDQINASRKIYAKKIEEIESMSDTDLSVFLTSAGTVDRVLGIASAGTVARVLRIASADTVARVLRIASDDTVARVLRIASDDTVARITSISELVVPIVDDLDEKVAKAASCGNLDMSSWHCGTTHCRAGWAITLGGEAGAALEEAVGPEMAGRLIYEASTGRPAPNFFASNAEAMEDIMACAARKEA